MQRQGGVLVLIETMLFVSILVSGNSSFTPIPWPNGTVFILIPMRWREYAGLRVIRDEEGRPMKPVFDITV